MINIIYNIYMTLCSEWMKISFCFTMCQRGSCIFLLFRLKVVSWHRHCQHAKISGGNWEKKKNLPKVTAKWKNQDSCTGRQGSGIRLRVFIYHVGLTSPGQQWEKFKLVQCSMSLNIKSGSCTPQGLLLGLWFLLSIQVHVWVGW